MDPDLNCETQNLLFHRKCNIFPFLFKFVIIGFILNSVSKQKKLKMYQEFQSNAVIMKLLHYKIGAETEISPKCVATGLNT